MCKSIVNDLRHGNYICEFIEYATFTISSQLCVVGSIIASHRIRMSLRLYLSAERRSFCFPVKFGVKFGLS